MAKKKPARNGAEPLEQLKSLYAFMVEKGLASIELTQEDFHVRLVRRGAYAASAPAAAAAPEAASSAPPSGTPASDIPPGAQVVKSPMMGIFYRAATPSSPPFAREGDTVKKGQVLCLIEAMKVFNEIKADADCRIVKVTTDNGKPVKAGQPLFVIEKL